MDASVIVFPGSNCDRDVAVALRDTVGRPPRMVWHGQSELPKSDLIVVPGGFSYGDYLRCGAMAAHSPIMKAVVAAAHGGTPVLGICNGFQILTEARLLPGALLRNAGLSFVCRTVSLTVETNESAFTRGYDAGTRVKFPVAHAEGSYFADDETLDRLEGEGLVAFRYAKGDNPNGAARDIAGIFSKTRTVLGLMPHPERAFDSIHPSTDGRLLFAGLLEALG